MHLLPRALGSMGRHQNVGAAQRIVSAVGDVVQDVFHGFCLYLLSDPDRQLGDDGPLRLADFLEILTEI